MKHISIIFFFCLASIFSYCQSKDTLIRKKYVDSLKREVASYKLQTYSLLNEYEKVANENTKLKERNQCIENSMNQMEEDFRRIRRSHGYVFAGLILGGFIALFSIAHH